MTQKQPKEQRMNSIVTAAVSEFLEKGYENTSMEAVALRAGITKGGLYHHFTGKDELLLYVNSRLSEPVEALVRRACASRRAVNGLRAYIREYILFWAGHPRELAFFFLTMTKALESPGIKKLYTPYYIRMKDFFAGLFSRCVKEGSLRRHDQEARGVALLSALDGVLAYTALNSDAGVKQVISQIQNVFVDSLSASASPRNALQKRSC
jgi:AcrR family transcriptional regulator